LSDDELAATVAATHKRGKLAIVHISTQEDARIAIAAGADGIAHLFADAPPRADVVSFMRRRHAFAITTLTATQSVLGTVSGALLLADRRLAAFLSPDARAHMKEPMPFRCSGELVNAFAAVKRRLEDRGRIAPGLRADLLLVHGDPTKEITATREIVAIWKAGVLVQRRTAGSALAL
jgi:hypothetical protein